jgi:hypothetical protein
MLTAGEARAKALNDLIVLREIRDIEEEILLASAQGLVSVEISQTSTMCKLPSDAGYSVATEYYDSYAGARDDRPKYLQMEKVLSYFSDLGYTIDRKQNSGTGTTFSWLVNW